MVRLYRTLFTVLRFVLQQHWGFFGTGVGYTMIIVAPVQNTMQAVALVEHAVFLEALPSLEHASVAG